MFKWILILFLAFNFYDSRGQVNGTTNDSSQVEAANDAPDILSDTSLHFHTITLPPDTIAAWKNNKKYGYVKNLDSLLKISEQQMAAYASGAKTSAFSNIFSSVFIRFFLWAVVIGLIIFILYRFFLVQAVFRKSSSSLPVSEVLSPKDFDDFTDFDALLQRATANSDYRLAVRFLFLKTLARLFEKGILEKSAHKTNYEYAEEISADKKTAFSTLVLSYEYSWYGNQVINAPKFEELEKTYILFYNKI